VSAILANDPVNIDRIMPFYQTQFESRLDVEMADIFDGIKKTLTEHFGPAKYNLFIDDSGFSKATILSKKNRTG
jgi:hypothetical protein